MAEFDKLDSYVDESGLIKDTDFFLAQFKKIEDGALSTSEKIKAALSNLSTPGSSTKASIDGIKELSLTTANYQKVLAAIATEVDNFTDAQKAALKAINEQYKAEETARAAAKETVNLIKTEIAQVAKKEAALSQSAKTIAQNRAEQAALNRELKLAAAVNETERNSLGRAQALILLYTDAKKKLNLATEEGRLLNESYNKAIQKSNDFILKNADAETKRTKNIGNYSKSAQLIVDAFEKQQTKLTGLQSTYTSFGQKVDNQRATVQGFARDINSAEYKQAANDLKAYEAEFTKLGTEVEQTRTVVEGFRRITEQPQFLNVAGKVGDATAELRFFTKALVDLERQGQGNSEAATALRKNLAELTDQIADAKAEVKALSSDTRSFDLFAGSVSFAADALQTAAGAAALFGASEEETQEAIKNVVAIQSIANGVKGIANELTTRGTAANKAYAFVQKELGIITNGSTSAVEKFNAAFKLSLIGLAVIAIYKLVTSLGDTADSAKLAATEIENFNTETENSITASNRFINSRKKQIELQIEDAKRLGKSEAEQSQIKINGYKEEATELDKLGKQRLGQLNTLAKGVDTRFGTGFISSFNEFNGRATNALSILTKIQEFKLTPKFQDLKDDAKSVITNLENAAKSVDGIFTSREDALANISIEAAQQATKNAEKAAAAAKKFREEQLKKRLEFLATEKEAEIQFFLDAANERVRIAEKTVNDENALVESQLFALRKLSNDKINIAAIEYSKAIADEQKVEDGKLIVIKKSKEQIAVAEQQFQIKKNIITEEGKAKELDIIIKGNERIKVEEDRQQQVRLAALESSQQAARNELQNQLNRDSIALAKKFTEGIINQEQYNLAKEKLDKEYAKNALLLEIDLQKRLVEVANLTPEAKKIALNKLLDLEKQVAELGVQNVIGTEEKKRAEYQKTFNAIKDKSEVVFGIVNSIIDASQVKQKNKLQQEKDDIETKTAAEIAAVTASADSEEKKAARIAIINARAQSQKEAIARKERQLEIDKAKFEKAQTIFRLTLALAEAIASLNPFKIGAATLQLGVAIATPIPKFAKGLQHDYEGPAIVGDGKRKEAIIRKDGSIEITPDTDTLTYINKGDRIAPDADAFMRDMELAALSDVARTAKGKVITEQQYAFDMAAAFERQAQLLTAIKNKPENHVSAKDGALVSIWKYGANTIKYFDENTNW